MQLSLIISTHNDPIGACITMHSTLQKLKPCQTQAEIVFCHDGSSAEWEKLLSVIDEKYRLSGQVKLIRSSPASIFLSRKLAVEASCGRLLLFIDSHVLFGYSTLQQLLQFEQRQDKALGFIFPPLAYAHKHPNTIIHSRDPNTFLSIRFKKPSTRHIVFRGMPLACRRSVFDTIGGYGCLAEHALSWGGGDAFLGLKAHMLGYRNWYLHTDPVIHLGPWPRNEGFFPVSAINGSNMLGFLVTSYILGGEELMQKRAKQVEERVTRAPHYTQKDFETARSLASADKAWFDSVKVCTYRQLLT